MRPLDKKNAGDSIELYADIFDMGTTVHTIKSEYKEYGKARKVLLANFGNYCSYCENYFANGAAFQTEHVQPKGLEKYVHLKTVWDNFLLSCPTCNYKKGDHDVIYEDIHLPHRNNTYLSLVYKEAGVVEVNPALSSESQSRAQALIDLVKLDNPDSETDFRCDVRRQTWDKAQMFLTKYENGEYDLCDMFNTIKECCCWSIWFTVFKDHPEVRKELIDKFPGTAKDCFDPNNGYEPIACVSHPV